jgi:SAM-dependent methyltransferase
MAGVEVAVPPELGSEMSGPTDPIPYYFRGWGIGKLFRRRIAMGLEMLPPLGPGSRVLEVGYGAGLVLFNLGRRGVTLDGLDLDADPAVIGEKLRKLGVEARLTRGSVLDMRGCYGNAVFDAVVCFSTLEHIREAGAAVEEMDRVTKGGGHLLVGMPAVNSFMEVAFRAIGFRNIDHHHVTTPAQVWDILRGRPERWEASRRQLPAGAPFGTALYHTFLVRKRL